MRRWLNVAGPVQFDLRMGGSTQQVVGKMIHADSIGCTIYVNATGQEHSYNWNVVEHITLAP